MDQRLQGHLGELGRRLLSTSFAFFVGHPLLPPPPRSWHTPAVEDPADRKRCTNEESSPAPRSRFSALRTKPLPPHLDPCLGMDSSILPLKRKRLLLATRPQEDQNAPTRDLESARRRTSGLTVAARDRESLETTEHDCFGIGSTGAISEQGHFVGATPGDAVADVVYRQFCFPFRHSIP